MQYTWYYSHGFILILLHCFSFVLTESKSSCSIEDMLVFDTGSDRVPPLGFDFKVKVVFPHSGLFCTASTCDLQLRIPVSHGENYESFEEAMIMSLKDNDGFGGV